MKHFKGKQFDKDVIILADGYYFHFSLSYRDVSELLKDRGVEVHHTTIYRWIQQYGNIIYLIMAKKEFNLFHFSVFYQLNNLLQLSFLYFLAS